MEDIAEQRQEQKVEMFKEKADDPGFLAAKGSFTGGTEKENRDREKKHIKNLASAIFMALTNHGYAHIRAVGRNATYNAVKAVSIASGYCKPKGIDLCWECCFDEGNLGPIRSGNHVQNVTAILFKVRGYKDWITEKEKEVG